METTEVNVKNWKSMIKPGKLDVQLSDDKSYAKLIAEERMKQFGRDVLHWINYDYVVINDDLEKCFSRINNLIEAEMISGSKDYDLEFIRNHVNKLTT